MTNYTETIQSLPSEYPEQLTGKNREAFLDSGLTIIVLDDDPTGTQTIYDVPVLTIWGEKEIEAELSANTSLFFILTNSRSLIPENANRLAFEIGRNIKNASEKTGRKTLVISRGDSTLRGHYPNEVDALGEGLGIKNAPHILIPAFFEGGRVTIDDVHYVRDGENLIPAGKTPFAQDSSFGYRSSNLKDYVEEKTKGRIKASQVVSISLNDLREEGPEKVASVLKELQNGQVCIVNATAQSDLDVFSAGFYNAVKQGLKPVLFRTAASIVPSLAGLPLKLPLKRDQIETTGKGGVVAVGSYVPMTSKQLDYLKQHLPVEYIEIQAKKLLDESGFKTETKRVSAKINANLELDRIVVIYTSREVIKGKTADESLQIVNRVSAGVVAAVRGIKVRPRFFIAKGGITSSDILTKSFHVKKAKVLGQIIPGVPVWQLNDCKPFPALIYMPFPGNLGGDDAICKAILKFI
ncbi:four-carbon acid sugar kinase family protein [Mariniphaga sp.]|uniref:four-carbon acid sugar kinase family protein n=1 Tax=Mariniphaga sp. TaxID=1954475 RepID=UPI003569302C